MLLIWVNKYIVYIFVGSKLIVLGTDIACSTSCCQCVTTRHTLACYWCYVLEETDIIELCV